MRFALPLLVIAALAAGCGADHHPSEFAAVSGKLAQSEPNGAPETQNSAGPRPEPPAVERKIIYTVSLDVVVTQFDGVQSAVEQAVKQFPGSFVSEATLAGSKGMQRTGHWTIRVPQAKYEDLLAALRSLGEVTKESKQSEEVTEQFYDLASRLKNKKETEKRLLKIQEDRTGDLEQVLAVEREINRIREEIERMEGQLKRLDDLTSLTTIRLSVSELRTYQAPQPVGFIARVSAAWSDSLQGLGHFAQNLAIFCVAIVPWLPLWIALALIVRFIWRRLRPRKPSPVPMPIGPPAPLA